MKKILIAIIVIIILIFAYGQYNEHQRFHPKNANLKASKAIDLNYYNNATIHNYYNALEEANNYMHMQWSANDIDVRSPESDDAETTMAVSNYGKKIAKLNYYKGLLEQSKKLKEQGLTNEDIRLIETKGLNQEDYKKWINTKKYNQMILEMMPQKTFYSGESSPFVYELQKLLVKKGYDIPIDGVYKNITTEALKAFEEKNNLFADGKVDIITLKALLN